MVKEAAEMAQVDLVALSISQMFGNVCEGMSGICQYWRMAVVVAAVAKEAMGLAGLAGLAEQHTLRSLQV